MTHSHEMHAAHSGHPMCHGHSACHSSGHSHGCGCSCREAGRDTDDFARKMFGLALQAEHMVLMRLMEKHIEAKLGEKLDRIAALAAEAVADKMRRKSERKRAKRLYQEHMRDLSETS